MDKQTVCCRYGAVNFMLKTHYRHPTDRPSGRSMSFVNILLWFMFCLIHCSAAVQHPRVFPGRQVFNPSDAETGIFQSDCQHNGCWCPTFFRRQSNATRNRNCIVNVALCSSRGDFNWRCGFHIALCKVFSCMPLCFVPSITYFICNNVMSAVATNLTLSLCIYHTRTCLTADFCESRTPCS